MIEPMVATAADTITLTTRRWGNHRPHVLLIHGLGDGAFAWDASVSLLCHEVSGVSVDLRGHGDSPWDPLQRYATASLAADVISMVDSWDLEDLALIGHSLGAEVATQVAVARPRKVTGLALIEGGPTLERTAALLLRHQLLALPRRYDFASQLEELLAARYSLVDPATLHQYALQALRAAPEGGVRLKHDPKFLHGLQLMESTDYWTALDTVQCPILLVRGRLSALLTHEGASELPRRLRKCRLAELPGAGHAVPLENPASLCRTLLPWLKGSTSNI